MFCILTKYYQLLLILPPSTQKKCKGTTARIMKRFSSSPLLSFQVMFLAFHKILYKKVCCRVNHKFVVENNDSFDFAQFDGSSPHVTMKVANCLENVFLECETFSRRQIWHVYKMYFEKHLDGIYLTHFTICFTGTQLILIYLDYQFT